MNRLRLQFMVEISLVLAFSILVVIACTAEGDGNTIAGVKNLCNDKIKLKSGEREEHLAPFAEIERFLWFDEFNRAGSFQIWRQDKCLSQMTVTAVNVLPDDEVYDLFDMITITAEIEDPEASDGDQGQDLDDGGHELHISAGPYADCVDTRQEPDGGNGHNGGQNIAFRQYRPENRQVADEGHGDGGVGG